jgi:hypothetical protein
MSQKTMRRGIATLLLIAFVVAAMWMVLSCIALLRLEAFDSCAALPDGLKLALDSIMSVDDDKGFRVYNFTVVTNKASSPNVLAILVKNLTPTSFSDGDVKFFLDNGQINNDHISFIYGEYGAIRISHAFPADKDTKLWLLIKEEKEDLLKMQLPNGGGFVIPYAFASGSPCTILSTYYGNAPVPQKSACKWSCKPMILTPGCSPPPPAWQNMCADNDVNKGLGPLEEAPAVSRSALAESYVSMRNKEDAEFIETLPPDDYFKKLKIAWSRHPFKFQTSLDGIDAILASYPSSNQKQIVDAFKSKLEDETASMIRISSPNFVIFMKEDESTKYPGFAKRMLWALEHFVAVLQIEYRFDLGKQDYKLPVYVNKKNAYCFNEENECGASVREINTIKYIDYKAYEGDFKSDRFSYSLACHEMFHVVQQWTNCNGGANWNSWHESTAQCMSIQMLGGNFLLINDMTSQSRLILYDHHKDMTKQSNSFQFYSQELYVRALIQRYGKKYFHDVSFYKDDANANINTIDLLASLAPDMGGNVTVLVAFFARMAASFVWKGTNYNKLFSIDKSGTEVKGLEWFGFLILEPEYKQFKPSGLRVEKPVGLEVSDCWIAFILWSDFTTTVLEAQKVQGNNASWEFSLSGQKNGTNSVQKIVMAFAPKQYKFKPENPPSLVVL